MMLDFLTDFFLGVTILATAISGFACVVIILILTGVVQ